MRTRTLLPALTLLSFTAPLAAQTRLTAKEEALRDTILGERADAVAFLQLTMQIQRAAVMLERIGARPAAEFARGGGAGGAP